MTLLLLGMAASLAGCGQTLPGGIKVPDLGASLPRDLADNDPSVTKISSDATVPILLASNKPETTFTVNGTSLNPSKVLKVLVPPTRLHITAQAPCYRTLTQTAEAEGFGRASLFKFDFGNWDRVPGARGANCA
ncbi:hypothetical protein [Dankookia rubra]|uniref:hypothetical protein n=1 Tax=Dankookia rubra TaxID=1442381 RepID=UPI00140C12CC|nr:hypothetical protein [Dankookia rubra]